VEKCKGRKEIEKSRTRIEEVAIYIEEPIVVSGALHRFRVQGGLVSERSRGSRQLSRSSTGGRKSDRGYTSSDTRHAGTTRKGR